MDGEKEGREGGLIFFWCSVAGLLIRKCSSFTGEVSKYRGKKGFLFPLIAMRCHTLGFDEEASERAL